MSTAVAASAIAPAPMSAAAVSTAVPTATATVAAAVAMCGAAIIMGVGRHGTIHTASRSTVVLFRTDGLLWKRRLHSVFSPSDDRHKDTDDADGSQSR
jgi:hypothetical protein